MRTSYDICLEEVAAHGLGGVANRALGSFYKSVTVNAPPKSEFDKLLDELAAARAERARRSVAEPVSARLSVNGQMVKSIQWAEPAAKRAPAPANPPRRVVIVRRGPSPADHVNNAFAMLAGSEITPRQRVALTAALAGLNSAPAQPLMKAMPAHDDPTAAPRAMSDEPHSPRGLANRLKEIQGHLDRNAQAAHIAEAERLLASAQRMLANPERMSMGDAACLAIQLDDLRHKIQRNSDA